MPRTKKKAKGSSQELLRLLDNEIEQTRRDIELAKKLQASPTGFESRLNRLLLQKQEYVAALKALAAWKRKVDWLATRIKWDVIITKGPGRPRSKKKTLLEKKARRLKTKGMPQKSIAFELLKNPATAPPEKLRSMESRVSKALRARTTK